LIFSGPNPGPDQHRHDCGAVSAANRRELQFAINFFMAQCAIFLVTKKLRAIGPLSDGHAGAKALVLD
jgi:hypothetical protein